MNLIFIDIIINDLTLFTNMMSSHRVLFMYISCIYCGIPTCITITAGDDLLVVFNFIDTIFDPNISSAVIMSSIFTGQYGD